MVHIKKKKKETLRRFTYIIYILKYTCVYIHTQLNCLSEEFPTTARGSGHLKQRCRWGLSVCVFVFCFIKLTGTKGILLV